MIMGCYTSTHRLERLVEAGLVDKWKTDEILTYNHGRPSTAFSPSAGRRGKQEPRAITINHLQGAFFIYVIGGVLTLLVLMIEWVIMMEVGRRGKE